MPFESAVIVGGVLIAFTAFALTLAWVSTR
jgi:hypothetical protein